MSTLRTAAHGAALVITAAIFQAGCSGDAPLGSRHDGETTTIEQGLFSPLPTSFIGYEVIPNVIRNNGTDAVVVEMIAPPEQNGVRVFLDSEYMTGPWFQYVQDDGEGVDRVAGDGIVTAGPYFSTGELPPGPALTEPLVRTEWRQSDGSYHGFDKEPQIAIVEQDFPLTSRTALTDDIIVGSHLIELHTQYESNSQAILRRATGNGAAFHIRGIYEVLPDFFDMAVMSSTSRLERTGSKRGNNGTLGANTKVQVNYSGTGLAPFDGTQTYGSAGRLLSLNSIDTLGYGWSSANLVHELSHQWAAHLPSSLGLSVSGGHYSPGSSVDSLLGGLEWEPNGDGTFTLRCDTGRNGTPTSAAPLDLYMAGLISVEELPTLYRTSVFFLDYCDQVIPPESITHTVTGADIQAAVGVRTPGPAESKKDYHLAFIIESQRDLTDLEFAYYNELARAVVEEVPASEPSPALDSTTWKPITRYFGHGTTWRSDIVLPGDVCGDGFVVVGEECDDGNTADGDGCSSTCTVEIPQGDITVLLQHQSGDNQEPIVDQTMSWLIELRNDGTSSYDLADLTLRYYYTRENPNQAEIFEPFWATGPAAGGMNDTKQNLTATFTALSEPQSGADHYVELGFVQGTIAPGETGEFNARVRSENWGFYTLSDDFSFTFDALSSQIEVSNVAVFYNGALIGGAVPGGGQPAVCGDSVVEGTEQCDDGNTAAGDGCGSTCVLEVCGNGVVDPGESCDDGNTVSSDGCSSTCVLEPVCGDGIIAGAETCDDGNTITEVCDYGVTSCIVCSAGCQRVTGLTSYCGDGDVDAANGEQCDDRNTVDGDGCSSTCTSESSGGECVNTLAVTSSQTTVDLDVYDCVDIATPYNGYFEVSNTGCQFDVSVSGIDGVTSKNYSGWFQSQPFTPWPETFKITNNEPSCSSVIIQYW